MEREEYEEIPWSALVPAATPMSRRLATLAMGTVIALAVGFVGMRVLSPAPPRGVVVDTAPDSDPEAGAPGEPATDLEPDAIGSAAKAAIPDAPRIYSEADLMAVLPEEEIRMAVMRAEWFTTDFFTVDGDVGAAESLRAALPGLGSEIVLPQEAPGGVSYVEWARAYRVEPKTPGRYVVSVAFRMLAGTESTGLKRSDVRAVQIEVVIDEMGRAAIADLPAIIEPPSVALPLPLSIRPATPDPAALSQLIDRAAAWGGPASVLESGRDTRRWRLVVSITDSSGLLWPLIVHSGSI